MICWWLKRLKICKREWPLGIWNGRCLEACHWHISWQEKLKEGLPRYARWLHGTTAQPWRRTTWPPLQLCRHWHDTIAAYHLLGEHIKLPKSLDTISAEYSVALAPYNIKQLHEQDDENHLIWGVFWACKDASDFVFPTYVQKQISEATHGRASSYFHGSGIPRGSELRPHT